MSYNRIVVRIVVDVEKTVCFAADTVGVRLYVRRNSGYDSFVLLTIKNIFQFVPLKGFYSHKLNSFFALY